jgi:transcriptional regulator with XRE-family HTH domain
MRDFAANFRRLMARSGMTLQQVIEATGLSERTVKAMLGGKSKLARSDPAPAGRWAGRLDGRVFPKSLLAGSSFIRSKHQSGGSRSGERLSGTF